METKKTNSNLIWIYLIILIAICSIGIGAYYYFNKPTQITLVASGHPEWPPIMWQDEDKIIGAGPDLVTKICDDLKIKCEVNYTGQWQQVQDNVKNGNVDMLVAAYKTKEREEYMDYSEAYTQDPITLFIKSKSNFNYQAWDDLIGKKGVIMTGDSYGQEFDNFIEDKLSVEKVATAKEAFDKITSGNADYFVYALYSGRKTMNELGLNDTIESIPNYIASENFYITIGKDSPFAKYLPKINELIKTYIADGTISELIMKNENESGVLRKNNNK